MAIGAYFGNSSSSSKCYVFFIFLLSSFFIFNISRADDTMVLPKGRWMGSIDFNLYPYWDTEFNNDGKAQSLAYDYSRELDDKIFPLLGELKSAFKTDSASLGRSIVDFEKRAIITNVLLNYGLSDKLSIGVKIPYWHFKTKVKSDLDKKSATFVKNPYISDPNSALYQIPLIPASMLPPEAAEALKLTREDILDLLSEGIPGLGIKGYGYKRFETWSDNDIGDIELGLKYKYFENTKWRLALQTTGRFPTGRKDDPDNLVDYGFGGGNYDIIIALQNDFIGFQDFILNGTIRYTNQLPDKETLRIPPAVNLPLTDKKERVDRDQGDILELEFSTIYKFYHGCSLNITYSGFFKDKDSIKGEKGQRYSSLEDETNQIGHTLLLGLSYNNLARYQEKLSRIPFLVSLGHWHRFDGKNINKAQFFSFKAALFF